MNAPQLSRIGKYRLIASLGKGGMANVHLALMAGPAGFNKLLVIKALRADMAAQHDELVTMFLDEARLAARLSHSNVVQTYEVGAADGRYFIAMEYLEGQTLRTIQRRLSPEGLSLPHRLRVLAEVAKGLHYAHELRGYDGEPLEVVHRDISPQNVFLTYEGSVKLLDFGIAKTTDAEHLTKVGVIKGKADYIAPEQIRGEPTDRRADVFSLGVMLWEALASKSFAGGTSIAEVTKMHNRLTAGEAKLREVNPDVPERLAVLCERAIALDPDERCQTAMELARELEDYLAELSLHPSAEELSSVISPPFEKERSKLRALIDEQVKLASQPNASFEAATSSLPMLGPGAPVPRTPPGVAELSSPAASAPPPPNRVPRPLVAVVLMLGVVAGGFLAMSPPEEPRSPAPAAAAVTPPAPAPRPAPGPALAPRPQPAPSPQPALAPAPTPLPEEADTVHFEISVRPSRAAVILDGARLGQLPFAADMPRDTAPHTVEVSAPGYVSERQVVTFDRNQTLRVSLRRQTRQRVQAQVPPATKVAAPEAPPSEPAGNPAAVAEGSAEPFEPGMDLIKDKDKRRISVSKKLITEDPYQ